MSTPTFPTQQFADFGRRGQEATTSAAEATTHALRAFAEAVAPRDARPVDPRTVTTAGFDLAERLLRVQRDFVTSTVALMTEAGQAATAQASVAGETLRNRTEQATERVVDFASETTRRAATSARNGVSV